VDTYAADLAALVEELDLHDAVHVGHSTGAGEVVRYIARHGTSRVAKVVLVGAVTPLMVKSARNPLACRSRPSTACALACWPTGRSSSRVERAVLRGQSTERESVAGNPGRVLAPRHAGRNPGILASIKAFSESDHTTI